MTEQCTTCDKVKELYKWTPEEKRGLRDLAKWCLQNWPSLYRAFVNTSKTLAAKGKEVNYDWTTLVEFERNLAAICVSGNMLEAAVKMAECLVEHIEKYLGGSDDPDYRLLLTELSGFQKRLATAEQR